MLRLGAHGLRFRYPGGVIALDGLDLAVEPGERLAILGANGSGKTTLLLHLNGSLRPEAGEVRIDHRAAGYDRTALAGWRCRIALVLQDPDDQLFAGTVYQDVSFGPLNLGLAEAEVRARVQQALADLRIGHLADRPVHMLSLGQKRRAVIAGALAMHPSVLLLDEPTAGLDPQGVAHLLAVLRRLVERGTTIVFATHDVDLAFAWADRVALFAEGRVIACGPPEEALADTALLQRAHLRRPVLLDMALRARAMGLMAAGEALPRTVDAMLAALAARSPVG